MDFNVTLFFPPQHSKKFCKISIFLHMKEKSTYHTYVFWNALKASESQVFMTFWTLEDAAALSLMWNFFQMTVNKNQVPMVINTPFHIFSRNSKKFQLIEFQPTTNNARSAIFGAPGLWPGALIKMQSVIGPEHRVLLQNFFFFDRYGLK